ncbi:MAG TPA: hypothetical protein VHX12_02825 [Acidisoma sp.]|jgi:hypothetical protein|nr:hypothetical protein [Acidisoma sp.]
MRDPCSQHEPEAAQAARAVLVPQFVALRRMLAQLGGLALLSSGGRAETRDGIAVSFAALAADLAEVQDGLARAEGRLGLGPSLHRLREAAAETVEAIAAMEARLLSGRLGGPPPEEAGRTALRRLQTAQRLLLSIADDSTGFAMVDFSHACCCGPAAATRAEARRCSAL